MSEPGTSTGPSASTGIPGLDEVLQGGLPRNRALLVKGTPGSGKTTLGLHFLLEGLRRGEPGMLVVHSETEDEVTAVARSHGWDVGELRIHEWKADASDSKEPYSLFHAAEIELGDWITALLERVAEHRPKRLVFDAVPAIRVLSPSEGFYHRQLQVLRGFFARQECTTVLIDDLPEEDHRAETLMHGTIVLENLAHDFGPERRRLRVLKMRGTAFSGGYHDFVIRTGGIDVFPRLVAASDSPDPPRRSEGSRAVASGVEAFDALLGGGLDRGANALVTGPAGTGKSTLTGAYAHRATAGGESATVLLFGETEQTWTARLRGLGMDPGEALDEGRLRLRRLDPGQHSPGELAYSIRREVESGISLVVLDSLNGYMLAMAEERHVTMHLRELLTYLAEKNVTTLMTLTQHGMVGQGMTSPLDLSYLADAVVLLRYFETEGQVRRAISVMKKRTGEHERTIRELSFDEGGLRVGEPLRGFAGVLTGAPTFVGEREQLLGSRTGEKR